MGTSRQGLGVWAGGMLALVTGVVIGLSMGRLAPSVSAQTAQGVPVCQVVETTEDGRLELSLNPQIEPWRVGTQVWGLRLRARVRNTDAAPRTGLMTTTLFDANGAIVAVLTGYLTSVPPGADVTVEDTTMDTPASWARVEVRLESRPALVT